MKLASAFARNVGLLEAAAEPTGGGEQAAPDVRISREQSRVVETMLNATLKPRTTLPQTLAALVTGIVMLKMILVALIAFAGGAIASPVAPSSPGLRIVATATFGAVGFLLLLSRRADRRSMALGTVFLLISLAFARTATDGIPIPVGWSFGGLVRLALRHDADVYLPLYLWLFVAEFPKRPLRGTAARIAALGIASAWIAAGLLTMVSVARAMAWTTASVTVHDGLYWVITFGLGLAALLFLVVRSRTAAGPERRRAHWFIVSLCIGLLPLFLEVVLAALWPAFARWAQGTRMLPVTGTILMGCLLTVPVSTTYAVLAAQVIDVRLVLRRLLASAVTKGVLVVVSLTPVLSVAVTLYRYQSAAIGEVLARPEHRILVLMAATGILTLACADGILRRIDQMLFGPSYCARTIVRDVGSRLGRIMHPIGVAASVRQAIAKALDPVTVAVVVRMGGQYVDEDGHLTHQAVSPLIDVVAASRDGVVPLTDRLLGAVNESDASWLARTGAEWLVRIPGSDGSVLGVIAIAERSNERPYFDEDRLLVLDLAAAAGTALERQAWQARRRQRTVAAVLAERRVDIAAAECPTCGVLTEPTATECLCPGCGIALEQSLLPVLLLQKFRLRRRLGRGGMGVVYLADDLRLGRPVALKALAYRSGCATDRSRQEARLMATVAHPHLATIFGCEQWQDQPVLVVEYLPNGTLADLLQTQIPAVSEVLDWGVGLCDALACLHHCGIVHGDIKPSNIGFDARRVPKLLDFGLAGSTQNGDFQRNDVRRWGTSSYQRPDANGQPQPEDDLWSLAAVLYETLTQHRAGEQLEWRGGRQEIRDIRDFRADLPVELVGVFQRALAACEDLRPGSAEEFGLWLQHARPID